MSSAGSQVEMSKTFASSLMNMGSSSYRTFSKNSSHSASTPRVFSSEANSIASLLLRDQRSHRLHVQRRIEPMSIDEESRRALHARDLALLLFRGDPGSVLVAIQIRREA